MRTPKIRDAQGNINPCSISEIIKLNIGGVEQYLMIRGKSIQNPILLFVHGGPGAAEIGYIRTYQNAIEEHFIVVRWDQRGAGLSYSKNIPKDTFTIDVFRNDLNEVTDYLIQRFNQPQIIIAGHSWGTVPATYAVKNHPDKYSAYIGIGQVVNSLMAEKISYRYVKDQAEMKNNKKVLRALEKIGEPPYTDKEALIRANCQGRIGGVIKTNPPKSIISSLIVSTEYNLIHKLNYFRGSLYSAKTMYSQIMKVDFLNELKQLDIPIFFIAGKYDFITPTTLVHKFYDELTAPMKELIIFENSGHLPQLEEHEHFAEVLGKIRSKLVKI